MRPLNTFAKFAIFGAAALLVLGSIPDIYNQIGCDNAEQGQEKYCAPFYVTSLVLGASGEYVSENRDEIIAFSTFLLTIVTGGLVWIGYRQIKTTRAQLRAYISVTPNTFGGFRAGHIVRIGWKIANHGQTPATGIKHHFGMGIFPQPLPSNFQFPPPDRDIENGFALFPHDDVPAHFNDDIARPLTVADIAAITANTQRFHCWGFSEYRDAFGKHWHLKLNVSAGGPDFARAMNPLPDAGGGSPAWNWEYGDGHNETYEA